MIALYHQYIEHAAGGLGLFIAVGIVLALIFIPLGKREAKLAQEVGPEEASARTSWPATIGFAVVLVVGLYLYLNH